MKRFTRQDIQRLTMGCDSYVFPSDCWGVDDYQNTSNYEANLVNGQDVDNAIFNAFDDNTYTYWEVVERLPERVEVNCTAQLERPDAKLDSPAWLAVTVGDGPGVVSRYFIPIDEAGEFAW